MSHPRSGAARRHAWELGGDAGDVMDAVQLHGPTASLQVRLQGTGPPRICSGAKLRSVMLPLAADWATISSLATAGGTLVLAVATFASVRSANRSARLAEDALQEQRRPLFAPSRFDDPVQKIMFVERHWVKAEGGRAV